MCMSFFHYCHPAPNVLPYVPMLCVKKKYITVLTRLPESIVLYVGHRLCTCCYFCVLLYNRSLYPSPVLDICRWAYNWHGAILSTEQPTIDNYPTNQVCTTNPGATTPPRLWYTWFAHQYRLRRAIQVEQRARARLATSLAPSTSISARINGQRTPVLDASCPYRRC